MQPGCSDCNFRNSKTATQNSATIIVLAGVAGMSVLLYLFAFVYPYNIFKLYPYPRLAVYRFAQDNPMVIWWLASAFVIQSGLYWLGWRAAQRASGRTAWLIVLGGALAFSFVLWFIYPFDAADIFDSIMHGRILSVYGANPFRDVAEQFSDDPFYPYAAWRHAPSAWAGLGNASRRSVLAGVPGFLLRPCRLFSIRGYSRRWAKRRPPSPLASRRPA